MFIMVANMSLIYDIARRSSRAPRLDQDYDGFVSVRSGYRATKSPNFTTSRQLLGMLSAVVVFETTVT